MVTPENNALVARLREKRNAVKALLATNFYNFETLRGILRAASQLGEPLILQVTAGSIAYLGLGTAKALADSVSRELGVETWLHLDHAGSTDLIRRCLDEGFNSVMIDASEKPYEDNVRITRQIVALARQYGAAVEAELGYVARSGRQQLDYGYTDPEQARDFTKRTGIDMLAVAVGTVHGFYNSEPALDLERLKQIRNVTDVFLVLHGASGLPADQIRSAIAGGVCKINIATDTKNCFMRSLRKNLRSSSDIDLRHVFPPAIDAVTELILEKIKICSGVI